MIDFSPGKEKTTPPASCPHHQPPLQKHPHLPACLSPAFTSGSQDSPSSRRQEALKRSKPRPGAVARPGNTGERLSAPQPYFLASCRIAAVLHFASFLNALGFDFDISDPPRFLQKQGGWARRVRERLKERRERKKGGGKKGGGKRTGVTEMYRLIFIFTTL